MRICMFLYIQNLTLYNLNYSIWFSKSVKNIFPRIDKFLNIPGRVGFIWEKDHFMLHWNWSLLFLYNQNNSFKTINIKLDIAPASLRVASPTSTLIIYSALSNNNNKERKKMKRIRNLYTYYFVYCMHKNFARHWNNFVLSLSL